MTMTSSDLISTPFTASSTADDVLGGVDLTGVRAIVTGAASGIGAETARALTAADRHTVTGFVEAWAGPLHLLVNSAGLVTGGLERTQDGCELQFATNHLGHFALGHRFHDALALGASGRDGARIVSLSPTAHRRAGVDLQDLHFERRGYDPQIAYAQSKTANSLFAVEATRLPSPDGIVTNAVNPGGVATDLQRNMIGRSEGPRGDG